MHDIDRVLLETPELEDEFEAGEFEDEHEFEDEFEHEQEHEHEHEHEHEQEYEFEMHETHEVDLASRLLEVQSELELEQFIGDLLQAAAGEARRFATSKTGRQLGGILKQAALQSLPVLGAGLGGQIGGSGGERTGRALGDAARSFGMQLDGLSTEDKEFELARQYVRFANSASRYARRRANAGPPRQVAQRAVAAAARRYAPGLNLSRLANCAPIRRMATPSGVAPARAAGARGPAYGDVVCADCAARLLGPSGRWIKQRNGVLLLSD